MTLEEAIRQIGINERIRIRRTRDGIFVIRDIFDFYPTHRHQYLTPKGEWQDFEDEEIEPWG